MRAGFRPEEALEMLKDFARFDAPVAFLRTHPYATTRQEYLSRYVAEIAQPEVSVAIPAPSTRMQELKRRTHELRQIQKLYPRGSVSWQNLQRQIDALQ
jgi:hypothetical protein